MVFQDHVSIVTAIATILLVALSRFLVQLYRARVTIYKLKNDGLVWHTDECLKV